MLEFFFIEQRSRSVKQSHARFVKFSMQIMMKWACGNLAKAALAIPYLIWLHMCFCFFLKTEHSFQATIE